MKQTSLSWPRKAVKHRSTGASQAMPEQAARFREGARQGRVGSRPGLLCPPPPQPTISGRLLWGLQLPSLLTVRKLIVLAGLSQAQGGRRREGGCGSEAGSSPAGQRGSQRVVCCLGPSQLRTGAKGGCDGHPVCCPHPAPLPLQSVAGPLSDQEPTRAPICG